jgi:hypothetical protein
MAQLCRTFRWCSTVAGILKEARSASRYKEQRDYPEWIGWKAKIAPGARDDAVFCRDWMARSQTGPVPVGLVFLAMVFI